jgi:hypothetical protein
MKTENKLIAQDFYFYNNEETQLKGNFQEAYTGEYYTDLIEYSRVIRIFGTEKEIRAALTEYIENTGLNVDECYDYKEEAEGSFWYRRLGGEANNKKIREKLEAYTKLYKEKKQPLILRRN